jgi:hypothetical protein
MAYKFPKTIIVTRARKRRVRKKVKIVVYARLDYRLFDHPIVIEAYQEAVVYSSQAKKKEQELRSKLEEKLEKYTGGKIPSQYVVSGLERKEGTRAKLSEGLVKAKFSRDGTTFKDVDLDSPSPAAKRSFNERKEIKLDKFLRERSEKRQ